METTSSSKVSKGKIREVLEVDDFDVEWNPKKNHFQVSFYAPNDIGLKLALTKDNELVVVGFNDLPDGSMGPAEACGAIRTGDILSRVNHIDLVKLGSRQFVQSVSGFTHDKTVTAYTFNHQKGLNQYCNVILLIILLFYVGPS